MCSYQQTCMCNVLLFGLVEVTPPELGSNNQRNRQKEAQSRLALLYYTRNHLHIRFFRVPVLMVPAVLQGSGPAGRYVVGT